MLYHYIASDKEERIAEGDLEAVDVSQVLQFLAGKQLRPISIKPLKKSQIGRSLFGQITITDKIFLTKYLSLMLRVGTDLLSAINILIVDFDKPAMKNFLLEVRDNLSRGQPFYQAFAKYPNIFSATFVNLVRAAETSGNLQQTFEDLSISLSRDSELQSKIKSALIYPIIIMSVASVITGFLVTFALPKIAKVFSESGIRPPLFSRIVFSIGLFIGNNILIIGALVLGGVGCGLYFFSKNQIGREIFSRMLGRLPFVKTVYRELAIERFASTTSSLLKAGLPIIQTIGVAADTVGSEEFRASLLRISTQGLAKGLTIGEAFRRETVFPKVVVNLIAISEKAGHLEEVLGTLADFYAANIDATIKTLVATLEPLLLMTMGLLVGLIALSIIVPIYQLTTQF